MRFTDESFIYRIMGVDNGTTHMGVVIADLDLRSGDYHIVHAETYRADKMISRLTGVVQRKGALLARQMLLRESFYETLQYFNPHAIAVEVPFFMPGRVTTYKALSETMVFLQMAVEDYNPISVIHPITPGEAKKAVQTKNFTMKKVVIRECVLKLDSVTYSDGIDKYNLTEHEYDAIAVSRAYGEKVRKDVGYVR